MPDIEILSPRTVIRPFTRNDATDVYACISQEITRFMGWEPPQTMADFADVWQGWLPSNDDRSNLHMVARRRKDNLCLGIVGVHAPQSGTPELGIWLRREVHGIGLGRELIGAVASWTTKNYLVRYFEYPVAEQNIASRRIAEGFGGRVMEQRAGSKDRSIVYHIPPFF